MYEKTDKTTVVYYSKLQYTLQQTTIYTLEYQCKYFNITGTIIIGVNPSGGSDSAIAHWQSGYSDSALPPIGYQMTIYKTKGIFSNLSSVTNVTKVTQRPTNIR